MTEKHADEQASKLRTYYAQFGIDVDDLTDDKLVLADRHIRLNPAFDGDETLKLLKNELPPDSAYPHPVAWMHSSFDFYAIPGDFRLSQSPCYKEGRIYGQEVSSGSAVAALLTTHFDREPKKYSLDTRSPLRILDMCCAPGLKLCAISDYLRQHALTSSSEEDTVIGVDCSQSRLSTCRKIIEKHQIAPYVGRERGKDIRIRLYNNDGTKFGLEPTNLIFDSTITLEQQVHDEGRKRRNKSSKGRERKRLREIAAMDHQEKQDGEDVTDIVRQMKLFDLVLVDAECSTDGSLKHIQRQLAKEAGVFVRTSSPNISSKSLSLPILTNEKELFQLVKLQRSLVSNGFRLLKKGGQLVYSTCSLSEDQNENVVKWLLDKFPFQASIIELSFDHVRMHSREKHKQGGIVKEGSIPGTVRFIPLLPNETIASPQTLSGSGFFLAKIAKII